MLVSLRRKGYIALLFALALCAILLLLAQAHVTVKAQQQTPAAAAPPPPQGKQRPRRVQNTPPPPAGEDASMSDDDVVRVETDLTNVLFTAVDKEKRFVTTLRKEDVRVLENGVPQEVSIFQRETDLPLSLVLLVDASKSEELSLPDEKDAARAFIDSIVRPDKDRVAVISFTGDQTIEQGLTSDTASLHAAVERIKIVLPPEPKEGEDETAAAGPNIHEDPRGWTSIWDAIWFTSNQVMSQTPERTRRAVILLTDGDDTHSKFKKQDAIDAAIKANTVIYAIGIGDPDNYALEEDTLKKISERTGGRAFFPEDGDQLHAAFKQIEDELRSQYLIAYTPANRARDGSYRRINLEVLNPELRKQKLRLLYRQGYYAGRSQQSPASAAAQHSSKP